jgi:hypothetical protein
MSARYIRHDRTRVMGNASRGPFHILDPDLPRCDDYSPYGPVEYHCAMTFEPIICSFRGPVTAIAQFGNGVYDLHATILHLMGIDRERLIYKHQGRDFRLTDVHGHVVRAII